MKLFKFKNYQWNSEVIKKRYQIFEWVKYGSAIGAITVMRFTQDQTVLLIACILSLIGSQLYCDKLMKRDKALKVEEIK
jgi:hypothetical protein